MKNFSKITRALAAKKSSIFNFQSSIFTFLLVLGMASCGDGNIPEPSKFNIVITKNSNTSVTVQITAADENMYFISGECTTSTLLISPESFAQGKVDAKEHGDFPDGLEQGVSVPHTYINLDPNVEYAFWACEVDQDYKVVGKVEYKRVKKGVVIDEEQIDPKLAAPTGLQAEARESGMYEETFIDLKWNAVKNAAQYNVYYLNKEGQYDLYKTVSDCKCTVEFVDIFKYVEIRAGETEDESYYVVTFQVKAVNAEGKVGKPSEPKTVEIENDFV